MSHVHLLEFRSGQVELTCGGACIFAVISGESVSFTCSRGNHGSGFLMQGQCTSDQADSECFLRKCMHARALFWASTPVDCTVIFKTRGMIPFHLFGQNAG